MRECDRFIDSLRTEVYHELCLYGNAKLLNFMEFRMDPELTQRDTLFIQPIGKFAKDYNLHLG